MGVPCPGNTPTLAPRGRQLVHRVHCPAAAKGEPSRQGGLRPSLQYSTTSRTGRLVFGPRPDLVSTRSKTRSRTSTKGNPFIWPTGHYY